MNKEAKAAQAILGFLRKSAPYAAAGLAGAGAGSVAGHRFGVRAGAERMGNEMATAFSEANTKENKAIIDSFKAFNKKENAILANQYLRRGINMGYSMATAKPDKGVSKTASDIAEKAFYDELEKLGFSMGALKDVGAKAIKSLGNSFSRLGKNIHYSGSNLKSAFRSADGQAKRMYLKSAKSHMKDAVTKSPLAASIIGGTTLAGGGYYLGKNRPKRTVVDYRY